MKITAMAGAQAHPDSAPGTTPAADPAAAGTAAADAAAAAATGQPDAAKAAADAAAKATADAAAAAKKATDDAAAAAAAVAAAAGTKKAPDKYALTIPDTVKDVIATEDLADLEQLARLNDLTNEDAQALLEEHATREAMRADRLKAQTLADPDYGGDKFTETKRLADSVINRIRPEGHARRDSFLRFIGRGGAGNHIEVISFLADLGKLMGEDVPGLTRGSTGSVGDKRDVARVMYDHPTSQALDRERGA